MEKKTIAYVASGLSILGFGLAFVTLLVSIGGWVAKVDQRPATAGIQFLNSALENLSQTLTVIKENLSRVDRQLQALREVPESVPIQSELRAIRGDFGVLMDRVGQMEAVITDNPAKALSVTLLRRDLDHLQETQDAQLAALRQDLSRVHDDTRWLIGLMMTMAIALIGIGAGALVQARRGGTT